MSSLENHVLPQKGEVKAADEFIVIISNILSKKSGVYELCYLVNPSLKRFQEMKTGLGNFCPYYLGLHLITAWRGSRGQL